MEEGKAKKNIGILVGSFYSDYSRLMVDNIQDKLQQCGHEVFIFPGSDSMQYLHSAAMTDAGSGYHYYSQYTYSAFIGLDVLIILFGTISHVSDHIDIHQFLKGMPDVPVIMLESGFDIPDIVNIDLDYYAGMRSLVDHLIEEHNCRNIVYISGPNQMYDFTERLHAYQDSLFEHGITVEPQNIYYGDGSPYIDDIAKKILGAHTLPDAIVASNDLMAECVYRIAGELGLEVGTDILVTGYDDLPPVKGMEPPLTTVRQDYEGVGHAVIDILNQMRNGVAITLGHIPTRLVIRESCGCKKHRRMNESIKDLSRQIFKNWSEIKQLRNQEMLSAFFIRSALEESQSLKNYCQVIGELLRQIGTKQASLFLLEKPMQIENKNTMFLPSELKQCMKLKDSQVFSYSMEEADCFSHNEAGRVLSPVSQGKMMAGFLLYFGKTQFGMLFVESDTTQLLFYYVLALSIGSGLQNLTLSCKQQIMQQELRKQNQELDYLNRRDTLTGLYNRYGILSKADSYLKNSAPKEKYVAVMADLDHLKQINDSFGHQEGDAAILAAASLLRDSIPEGGIAGRTGGDEFVCLFPYTNNAQIEDFIAILEQRSDKYNCKSDKPYYINVSVGCYRFSAEEETDISEILNQADKLLYEAKKRRRSSVIKESEKTGGKI